MDIGVILLKLVADTLSSTEVILILCLVLVLTYSLVKFILRNARNKGFLSFLNNEDPQESLVHIKNDVAMLNERVTTSLEDIKEENKKLLNAITELHEYDRQIFAQLAQYAKDIDSYIKYAKSQMDNQFEQIKYQLHSQDNQDNKALDLLQNSIAEANAAIHRISTQLERLDEYAKMAIPEFKVAHREISKDLSSLSRDIALVERSLQNQINNAYMNNGVILK